MIGKKFFEWGTKQCLIAMDELLLFASQVWSSHISVQGSKWPTTQYICWLVVELALLLHSRPPLTAPLSSSSHNYDRSSAASARRQVHSQCKTLSQSPRHLITYYLWYFADVAAYLLKKEVEKIRLKSYLDSKSTLFEVINNFRLYDRVCIVSALRPCLDTPKNPKLFKIPHYIESCDTCMKH